MYKISIRVGDYKVVRSEKLTKERVSQCVFLEQEEQSSWFAQSVSGEQIEVHPVCDCPQI